MKLSIAWIFDHIDADWHTIDIAELVAQFNKKTAEIESVQRLADDYILLVDNKSITNRPDLWGHRGFAREIAAILGLKLKPLEPLLTPAKLNTGMTTVSATTDVPWDITINAHPGCNRFALAYLAHVKQAASIPWMMERLTRVDIRPINAIVDITNYVMADIGRPMHAFDADRLRTHTMTVRYAHAGEKLQTLDQLERILTAEDMVVTDGDTPISLAGIMGGSSSSVTEHTTRILIEAAHFDPTTIRRTAERQKVRTEAAARFEKSPDPMGNIEALRRFAALAQSCGISTVSYLPIQSVGPEIVPPQIQVTHSFLQDRLGVTLSQDEVLAIMRSLEFHAVCADGVYTVTIPTFRASKDITRAEDIVEEVGRMYGYDAIVPQVPRMRLQPSDMTTIARVRLIKQYLAYAHQMSELYTYALYDESFLRHIGYEPRHTLEVQDPVSENWRRLVTSLIPHLYKAVVDNHQQYEQLRFFESGRTWQLHEGLIVERKAVAGIVYDKRATFDFYAGKIIIEDLLRMLGLSVAWSQEAHPADPWYEPYTTARLISQDHHVGIVGMLHSSWSRALGEGAGWIFELDGAWLAEFPARTTTYQPTAKFPEILRDVSVCIDRGVTVDQMKQYISSADARIVSVQLIDFFEKQEWATQRSVSLRYTIRDDTKTLTKQEADGVSDAVVQQLVSHGGTIR